MTNTIKTRQNEQGNALFLILIAVVLFAALSYAITQSNRSSGNAGRETNTISGTTITQYTSGIRTGITRMLLRGTATSDLLFNPPASYSATTTREVFHPDGGGVGYQDPDLNVIETGGLWYYLINKPVTNIATTTGDVVAVLTNVKKGICEQLNQQIRGTTTIPTAMNGVTMAAMATDGTGTPFTGLNISGQPFGCIKASDGNVFYHVLAEQ
jgi:hypothetical protein